MGNFAFNPNIVALAKSWAVQLKQFQRDIFKRVDTLDDNFELLNVAGAEGYQVTHGSVVTTTSTSQVDLTYMSQEIEIAEGDFVVINFDASYSNSSPPNGNYYQVIRDSTGVSGEQFVRTPVGSTDGIRATVGLTAYDKPDAGTYTYKIGWRVNTGTGATQYRAMSLVHFKAAVGIASSSSGGGGGAVDSVNGYTGAVVLDADDIDDASTSHKFVTASDLTTLSNTSGTNTGDQDLTNYFDKTVDDTDDITEGVAKFTTAADITKLLGIETGAQVNTVLSVNTATGAVVLDADDISDAATTNKFTTAGDISKLAGIAAGATVNSPDATLLDRANHTGTQTASTISDFDTEVSNNTDVAANTAVRHVAVTVSDSSELDFTLTGQDVTASIIAGSIDETKLDASTNASLDLADSALQSGDNVSALTNDAGYITSAPAAPVDSVNTKTGVVVLDPDDLSDTSTTNKFTTAAEISKLAGIATGATANDTDANLLNRANHTGTQTASTISDFDTEVGNNASVTANTAKVTNATHTGEVTGSGALTVDSTAVSNKTLKSTLAGTEEVLVNDAGTLKKTTSQDIADLASVGGGVTSVNGDTGTVVLDADDIDDASTAHKFVSSGDITNLGNLSGTNTGDQDISTLLVKASNLSDVASAATSRTNLGLDTMATQAASAVAITGGDIDDAIFSNVEMSATTPSTPATNGFTLHADAGLLQGKDDAGRLHFERVSFTSTLTAVTGVINSQVHSHSYYFLHGGRICDVFLSVRGIPSAATSEVRFTMPFAQRSGYYISAQCCQLGNAPTASVWSPGFAWMNGNTNICYVRPYNGGNFNSGWLIYWSLNIRFEADI